jgi:hypothetical protein
MTNVWNVNRQTMDNAPYSLLPLYTGLLGELNFLHAFLQQLPTWSKPILLYLLEENQWIPLSRIHNTIFLLVCLFLSYLFSFLIYHVKLLMPVWNVTSIVSCHKVSTERTLCEFRGTSSNSLNNQLINQLINWLPKKVDQDLWQKHLTYISLHWANFFYRI